ncbi:MAG: hypothetical protein Greene041619_795 [Candidatus Peregrinibacteria bacterium Greene0416_19]|nr:MAG: hypothetical protein Greene041619_795 [Candidatus Peregrinibacteria bacterium Greene0416_19]
MTYFLSALAVAYGMGGIVTFIGFFPTIRDLWRGKPSANFMTYVIWTATTFITSVYGFFILKNLLFDVVINLQLAACIIILILRMRLLRRGK